MPAAIEAMRDAFRQLSNGQVTLPTRERLDAPGAHGVALVMPCHSIAQRLFPLKFVVRAIRRAFVYDTDPAAAERFATEMTRRLGLPVERTSTPAKTLEDADVICTATTSITPVFADHHLPPGTHINGVGSYRPDMTEIPSATVCRARVVADHRAAALEEAGDLIGPLHQGLIQQMHVSMELGEILLGRSPGRRSASEVTLFKSVGVAIQDLCAAARAMENARRLELGVQLS